MQRFNRTGLEPTMVYTFKGMATVRAANTTTDFLVETEVEPADDGTLKICEAKIDGQAVVWGVGIDGAEVWYREDDEVACESIATWEASGALEKARDLARAEGK